MTVACHIGWGYLLIIYLDLGVAGAAISLNITFIINFLAQELYIRCIARESFENYLQPLFSKKSFKWSEAKNFLRLAVPGTMMQCAEWWAFELLAIFAGMLGPHHLAAQVAVINILGLIYMVPLGIQFTASANVGGEIGAGNPTMAKKHAISHVTYAVLVVAIIVVAIKFNEDAVAGIFTSDPKDIVYIHEVLDLISAYIMFDAIHGVNSGIVRALGKQFLASVVTIICIYALGLPLALVFGFKMEMGVRGFWLGFTVAIICQDIFVTIVIVCSNWAVDQKTEPIDEKNIEKGVQTTPSKNSE